MGSSRLPGKVLADINGKPALTRVLNRLRHCELLDGIVLATSTDPKDDVVVSWAESEGIHYYRGSEDDVLLRVVEAQQIMDADMVVEVCGDMTLLDRELIDQGIRMFEENDCDVVTTTCKPSYPIGADVVVFRLKDLIWVQENISDPEVREHVSLYFFQHPERYRIINLIAPKRLHAPDKRFVLDTPEDLEFIRAVYTRLEPEYGDDFGIYEVLQLLKEKPELAEINRNIGEKSF